MATYNSILSIVVIYFLCLIIMSFFPSKNCLPPVILVPGLPGSELEAQLNKPSVVHFYCLRSTYGSYILIWLNARIILPKLLDCWVDNMKLNFDSSSNTTHDQPGVYIRARDFGDPRMVEYLNGISEIVSKGYLNHLAAAFVMAGYVREQSLFAAPYDFRKGPSELNLFFEDLKKLVETAYYRNHQSPVTLIGHSYGGKLILNFLQGEFQQWKDKYIRAFISISAPFGGSMLALKGYIAGENWNIAFINPETIKEIIGTMPSVASLMPIKELWEDEILISAPWKNYTLDNLNELFETIGNPTAWKMYLNEKRFATDLSPPGVKTYCCYSNGIPTVKKFTYGHYNFPHHPILEYENGDGTVNIRSLEYCHRWINKQKEKVFIKNFYGIDHEGIVHNISSLRYIIETVLFM